MQIRLLACAVPVRLLRRSGLLGSSKACRRRSTWNRSRIASRNHQPPTAVRGCGSRRSCRGNPPPRWAAVTRPRQLPVGLVIIAGGEKKIVCAPAGERRGRPLMRHALSGRPDTGAPALPGTASVADVRIHVPVPLPRTTASATKDSRRLGPIGWAEDRPPPGPPRYSSVRTHPRSDGRARLAVPRSARTGTRPRPERETLSCTCRTCARAIAIISEMSLLSPPSRDSARTALPDSSGREGLENHLPAGPRVGHGLSEATISVGIPLAGRRPDQVRRTHHDRPPHDPPRVEGNVGGPPPPDVPAEAAAGLLPQK